MSAHYRNIRISTKEPAYKKTPISSLYHGLRMLRFRARELERAECLGSVQGKSPFLLLWCSRWTWFSYMILANSTKFLFVNQPTNQLTIKKISHFALFRYLGHFKLGLLLLHFVSIFLFLFLFWSLFFGEDTKRPHEHFSTLWNISMYLFLCLILVK